LRFAFPFALSLKYHSGSTDAHPRSSAMPSASSVSPPASKIALRCVASLLAAVAVSARALCLRRYAMKLATAWGDAHRSKIAETSRALLTDGSLMVPDGSAERAFRVSGRFVPGLGSPHSRFVIPGFSFRVSRSGFCIMIR
jgi:ferric-dicitrate binding protein FerR (iron transport regulator)